MNLNVIYAKWKKQDQKKQKRGGVDRGGREG